MSSILMASATSRVIRAMVGSGSILFFVAPPVLRTGVLNVNSTSIFFTSILRLGAAAKLLDAGGAERDRHLSRLPVVADLLDNGGDHADLFLQGQEFPYTYEFRECHRNGTVVDHVGAKSL